MLECTSVYRDGIQSGIYNNAPEAVWVPLLVRASSLTGDVNRSHCNLLQAFCTDLSIWAGENVEYVLCVCVCVSVCMCVCVRVCVCAHTYQTILSTLQLQSSHSKTILSSLCSKLCVAFCLQVTHLVAGVQREVIERNLQEALLATVVLSLCTQCWDTLSW